eukprot:10400_4
MLHATHSSARHPLDLSLTLLPLLMLYLCINGVHAALPLHMKRWHTRTYEVAYVRLMHMTRCTSRSSARRPRSCRHDSHQQVQGRGQYLLVHPSHGWVHLAPTLGTRCGFQHFGLSQCCKRALECRLVQCHNRASSTPAPCELNETSKS